MKKMIKVSFGSFVVVVFLGFIFLISSVENEKESYFSSYDLLDEDGSRYISWVPVFLPKTAFNIRIYADVETNNFYMFFQLEKIQSIDFQKKMNMQASKNGVALLQKGVEKLNSGWCAFQDISNGFGENLYLVGKVSSSEEIYYVTKAATATNLSSTEYTSEMAKKYCEHGDFKPEMQYLDIR
ncbi:hypothetical protein [Delftia acidovorans]